MAPDARVESAWPARAALAFLAALPLLLFFPAIFQGRLIYGHDTVAGGFPFHAEVLRSLAAHEWPLWMPDVLGGMPGVASCNLYFAYPTAFFGCLARLPFPLLLGLDAALHVFLAGTGMFLFLRGLGRGVPASLLGGVFFALSGSELSQLYGGFWIFVEGIAWTPWVFWAAHKGVREGSWSAWGLCGAAFALQILAGAAQLFAYTLAAAAFFALGEARDARKRGPVRSGPGAAALGLALALAFAGLLAAPQLWPTLRYLPLSARHGYSYAEFASGSLRLPDVLTWVVPGFFGWQEPTYHGAVKDSFTSEYFGLLPLCLAFGALAALWRSDSRVRRLAWIAAAALGLALCRWRPFYELLLRLPVLSGFRVWSRTLFLLGFAACALAARGWDALRDDGDRCAALRGALAGAGLAFLAALLAWTRADARAAADAPAMPWLTAAAGSIHAAAGILAGLAKASARRTLELLPLLAALLWFTTKRAWAGTTLALALALAFHGWDQKPLFERFVRFTDAGHALIPTRFAGPPPPIPRLDPWRVFDPDRANPNNAALAGYENLYGDESVPLGDFIALQSLASASPERFAKFLDLMGVRAVFRHSKLKSSEAGDQVTTLENPRAFPRAWLVGSSRTVPDPDRARELLFAPGFNPRLEAALPVDLGLRGGPPRGSVRWLRRGPQAFSLDVVSDRPAALVVSNFWYPAWKATVDGQGTPVLKADGALQAVAIPKGEHRVDFHYGEGLFNAALAACLAGLALLLGLGWMERRDGKKP